MNTTRTAAVRRKIYLLILGLAAAALVSQPPGPLNPTIRLAFIGDVMVGRGIAAAHQDASTRASALAETPAEDPQPGDLPGASPGWNAAFAFLRPEIAGASLAVANLESPITDLPLIHPSAYDLRASPASLLALTAAGMDAVSTANNHALDSGPAGQQATLRHVQDSGIVPAASGQMRFFLVGPYRVGLLAVDDVSAPVDLPASLAALSQGRAWVDILVVTVHWGLEYTGGPTPREAAIARAWSLAGADLIVGHHPHVLQPVEFLPPDPASGRTTLVAYSLGNALFDQPAPPATRWGALLLVDWNRTGLAQVSMVPFEINIRTGVVEPAGADVYAWVQNRVNAPRVVLRTDYR